MAAVVAALAGWHQLSSKQLSAIVGYPFTKLSKVLKPLFELGMRLGEGSGAVLGVGLVKSAIAVLREVRTFEEANIERPLAEGASG